MSNRMKVINISEKSKFDTWHIEAPGCIINVYPKLRTESGHRVTRISISADRMEGEQWFLPDFKEQEGIGVRVVEKKNGDGKLYESEYKPMPGLFEILKMGANVTIPWDKGGIHVSFEQSLGDPDKFIARFPDGNSIQYDLTERWVAQVWHEMRTYGTTEETYKVGLMEKYIHIAFDDFEAGQSVERISIGVLVTTIDYRRKDGNHRLQYLNRDVMSLVRRCEAEDLDDPNDVADLFSDLHEYIQGE